MAKRLNSQKKRGGHRGGADRTGQGPRIGHLDTLGGVVKEMAAVYREARLGQTKPDVACKLIYVLRELRCALEAQILERLELRLTSIEGGTTNGDTNDHRALSRPN